jgi:uncharacterized protein
MTEQQIIHATTGFVKEQLRAAEGGHDWFHIERVWRNALNILQSEPGNRFIVELGALLHDIADHKFNNGNETIGVVKARVFLESLTVAEPVITHVEQIIRHISFKGGHQSKAFSSPELSIVQDADRLDAIGAIGIARAFNYGGFRGRAMYDPSIDPVTAMTAEQYKASTAPTINHFYEKLLLLKDRMNTETGRKMALQRHRFMEVFLEEFYREWDGG